MQPDGSSRLRLIGLTALNLNLPKNGEKGIRLFRPATVVRCLHAEFVFGSHPIFSERHTQNRCPLNCHLRIPNSLTCDSLLLGLKQTTIDLLGLCGAKINDESSSVEFDNASHKIVAHQKSFAQLAAGDTCDFCVNLIGLGQHHPNR